MKAITGFFMAWGNFCFIPCPVKKWDENARIHMLMMLPLLGMLMGILWYGLFLLIQLFDIHFFAAAVFMACYPLVISGFIHLDGFMDCHDAIFSRQSLEKKREILKDPRAGAFAVASAISVAVVLFGTMASMLDRLDGGDISVGRFIMLIYIMTAPRAVAAIDVIRKKPMETSQYNRPLQTGKGKAIVFIAVLFLAAMTICGALSLHTGSGMGLLRTVIFLQTPWLVSFAAGSAASSQLGGMSGDIAGYEVVWGEMAGVAALALI